MTIHDYKHWSRKRKIVKNIKVAGKEALRHYFIYYIVVRGIHEKQMERKVKIYRLVALVVLTAAISVCFGKAKYDVKGDFSLGVQWTVFPVGIGDMSFNPSEEELKEIPESIQVGKEMVKPQTLESTDSVLDLKTVFGGIRMHNTVLLYQEIQSPKAATATLGFGCDWWFTAWLNGEKIADTGKEGNKAWPSSVTNYPVDVRLKAGRNLLVVKFSSGSGTSVFKAAGPSELKKIPQHKWDIQSVPVVLRDDFGGVSVEFAPQTIAIAKSVIVIPEKATIQEQTAAEELSRYLGRIVEKSLPIVIEKDELPANGIFVGNTRFASRVNTGIDSFAEEQWLNRTVEGNMILAGGGRRGTLYAVWHFLEDVCGVRWWTPYEESVPGKKELEIAPLDRQGKPAFSFRMFSTHNRMITPEGKEQLWAPRNRVNGELHYSIPLEYGGSMDYGTPGFVHTEALYLNEMKRRNILKPEWCALKDGVRGGKKGLNQLCFSNQEMRKAFLQILCDNIENDRKKLKNPPSIYNVSFNDTSTKCECKECAAIVSKYGCDTGLLLDFLNELANDIADDYPEVKIATLAYMNTEPLPFGIKPAENVIITFCDTMSNYIRPIPEDDRFGRLLKEWSNAAKEIYIWDYHSNFADKCQPMPFEYTIQRDWQLMRKNSATGIFTEYYPVFEDMHSLRLYLMAKIAEDPFVDQQRLINDFTDGYYGKAGVHIRRYLKLVNDAAMEDRKSYVSTQSTLEKCQYVTPALVVEMQRIFDVAEKAVVGDGVLLGRVRHARLAADKAAFILYPKIEKGALKESRDDIGKRIQATVDDRLEIVLKDVVPYWRKRAEGMRKKFLQFMEGEIVWDNCDDIERMTWGQQAWRPKPFTAKEVGKLSADTVDKVEGKGSIRFEVSYDDVLEKQKAMPKIDCIGFNYLHGSDFSRYVAYEFSLKCDTPQHPEIWCSIGFTKRMKLLERNEVTNGWKVYKFPSAGLFEKPCTHTYLRVFSTPESFKQGDRIDLRIDNMKLHTRTE